MTREKLYTGQELVQNIYALEQAIEYERKAEPRKVEFRFPPSLFCGEPTELRTWADSLANKYTRPANEELVKELELKLAELKKEFDDL